MATKSSLGSLARWAITLAGCLVISALLGFIKFREISGVLAAVAAQPEYSETVETTYPQPVDFTPQLETLGEVVAPQQLMLRNELAGYITEVKAAAGTRVSKGQLILQLDVREQRANLASARARLALANSVLQRDLDLQKSSFVSADKVDRSRAEVDVIKAEIDAIESVIDRRTIRAPFDGILGLHNFESGQYLDNNSEIATLVGSSGEMWVDFSVPQFYGELALGGGVQVSIVRNETSATTDALAAAVIAGDATIDAAARSRRYRAVVREGSDQLLDNMSVSVAVPLASAAPLMAVPSLSVQSDTQGSFVWVLEQDSGAGGYRARRQSVGSFGQQGDMSYVDGVSATDLVAAAGAFKLSPGLLVKTVGLPERGAQ